MRSTPKFSTYEIHISKIIVHSENHVSNLRENAVLSHAMTASGKCLSEKCLWSWRMFPSTFEPLKLFIKLKTLPWTWWFLNFTMSLRRLIKHSWLKVHLFLNIQNRLYFTTFELVRRNRCCWGSFAPSNTNWLSERL